MLFKRYGVLFGVRSPKTDMSRLLHCTVQYFAEYGEYVSFRGNPARIKSIQMVSSLPTSHPKEGLAFLDMWNLDSISGTHHCLVVFAFFFFNLALGLFDREWSGFNTTRFLYSFFFWWCAITKDVSYIQRSTQFFIPLEVPYFRRTGPRNSTHYHLQISVSIIHTQIHV